MIIRMEFADQWQHLLRNSRPQTQIQINDRSLRDIRLNPPTPLIYLALKSPNVWQFLAAHLHAFLNHLHEYGLLHLRVWDGYISALINDTSALYSLHEYF